MGFREFLKEGNEVKKLISQVKSIAQKHQIKLEFSPRKSSFMFFVKTPIDQLSKASAAEYDKYYDDHTWEEKRIFMDGLLKKEKLQSRTEATLADILNYLKKNLKDGEFGYVARAIRPRHNPEEGEVFPSDVYKMFNVKDIHTLSKVWFDHDWFRIANIN